MQIHNLLDVVQQNTINNTKNQVRGNNKTFENALSNILKNKTAVSSSIANSLNRDFSNFKDVRVINLSNTNLSTTGIKLLSKLDEAISKTDSNSNLKETLKSLQDILTTKFNDLKDMDDTLDDVDTTEDDTSRESVLLELIAFLSTIQPENQLNTISESNCNDTLFVDIIDKSLLDDIRDNDNIDSDLLSNSLEDVLDSIDSKLSNLSESLSEDDLNSFTDVINKILDLSLNSSSKENTLESTSKKEDIEINFNNLDIRPLITNQINLVDSSDGQKSVIHPIARQVLENIQAQLSSLNMNSSTIEIRLKLFPSKLGSISVVIAKDSNSLNVKLISDNAEVRNLLTESIQSLRFELEKSNQSVINVDVSSEHSDNNKENKQKENVNMHVQDIDSYLEDVVLRIHSQSTLIDRILDVTI